ncbi:MAG: glutamate--tRNA ligase [Pseudomonadota bacterium]|nr:glutamate--tRNA ligase [Pseudomonadota bacterium]
MTVITRFAPSPTGYLHIGGARTALFNWLYAKHHGGKFFLRIEDTDRQRSTPEAIEAIIDGLRWLGLDCEGDAVYQYARSARHADVAHELLKHGRAFKCYTTQAELEEFRKEHPNAKFRSPWRDGGHSPPNTPYVIRLKAPLEGETTVQDKVQGTVSIKNSELDDMVLLRSDGTPTYMLAVVVDDHDMGVTQVIRGDDHLTNTFRQLALYDAMNWPAPDFAHIPLIHGPDGAKLSKRHGALGVEAYRDMGYLPEAMRNYLLRLGWSHGDEEIISTEQAIKWFDLDAVGKSPSRFDFAKLDNLNAHYLREAGDERLVELILPFLPPLPPEEGINRLLRGMSGLKARAKTLKELAANAVFYIERPPLDAKAQAILDNGGKDLLKSLLPVLEAAGGWQKDPLEQACREFAEPSGQKLGAVAQPLRAALTGSTTSPPIFEVMEVLGKEESIRRIKEV